MGLDMYLTKRTYVKNWKHTPSGKRHQITIEGPSAHLIQTERISEIVEDVAYWRKANHIHNWFVENVQEGNDDCREYYVSTVQLKELVDICKRVVTAATMVDASVSNGEQLTEEGWIPILVAGQQVENLEEVKKLLPTQRGFFFGNTDYDKYYVDDCAETIKALEPLLESPAEFYYRSSW